MKRGACRFDSCRPHLRLRSSTAELPTLNRRVAGSNPAGVTWKDCHRRGTPSRKRVGLRAVRVRFPLLPLKRLGESGRIVSTGGTSRFPRTPSTGPLRGRALRAGFDSLSFRSAHSSVVEREDARLLLARRRFDPCRWSLTPSWSNGDDAGPSTRKLRVRVPPRVLHIWL